MKPLGFVVTFEMSEEARASSSLEPLEPGVEAESDDEVDWEEVAVPVQSPNIEITLQTRPKASTSNTRSSEFVISTSRQSSLRMTLFSPFYLEKHKRLTHNVFFESNATNSTPYVS